VQAKIYEFLKTYQGTNPLLIAKDYQEALNIESVCKYLGFKAFIFPDIRVGYGEDLRAYKNELIELFSSMSDYYFDKSKKKVIISPLGTIAYPLPKKELFKREKITFADTINLKILKDKLFRWGYNFVDIVEEKGEVSFRGDIIDIFSINYKKPVRISLFDDECESIRFFECENQKSLKEELEEIEITPVNFGLDKKEYQNISNKVEKLESNSFFKDINSLGFWVLDDLGIYYPEIFDTYLSADMDNEIEELKSFYPKIKDIRKYAKLISEPKEFNDIKIIDINPFLKFHLDKKIKILAKNDAIVKSSMLDDEYKKYVITNKAIINIISKNELIISLNKRLPKQRRRISKIVLDELKSGDYVVHEDYGIGIFKGLENATVLGAKRDFIQIFYQNNDKLLLPVENIDKIDRYVSDSGALAVVDRLGKGSFTKLKEKVREKLFEIAKEIVELAAIRELENAVTLKSDMEEVAIFQKQAGFEYTKDQNKTINEIFQDLHSGNIMDRLLSGDVGFGKTEVAMNAMLVAYKNGFQSALIVPTTLLANQHHKTLKDRFEKFNINIYKLDRFTSSKDKKIALEGLENGKVSIVIGTHALFNAKFKNLALLVIDEEHKFGVKQKEKLKSLKKNIHILSMSATPIPRSLNMALSSIKQYSQLLTPPLEKKDVRTFVKEFSKPALKEIISRELRRGGQIFYIHNRIATINDRKKYLQEIMPNLKILTLHSKISSSEMEKQMLAFENGEYDMLLSTSIVESGIHIPNVNSMVVENAENFGIADLHQLRGRVGRGKNEGYCYLMVQNKEKLSEISKKRLLALESNSFLGSGSVLAYHDLEIRGGGNLIGKAQSGHIKNIGYTQYLKMLEDSINELLNKKVIKKKEVSIKLNISAFINDTYIREDRLRLEIYRRLGKCESLNEVYEIEDELNDRFGEIDEVTKQFLDIICIKIMAIKKGVTLVSNYQQNISFVYEDGSKKEIKARSKDDDEILKTVLRELK